MRGGEEEGCGHTYTVKSHAMVTIIFLTDTEC